MAKYQQKPIIIEAELYREGLEDGFIYEIENEFGETKSFEDSQKGLKIYLDWFAMFDNVKEKMIPYIKTSEGRRIISQGDYIITGIKGERFPCKPDIFKEAYDLIQE